MMTPAMSALSWLAEALFLTFGILILALLHVAVVAGAVWLALRLIGKLLK